MSARHGTGKRDPVGHLLVIWALVAELPAWALNETFSSSSSDLMQGSTMLLDFHQVSMVVRSARDHKVKH
jgi:hypothetical protein